MLALLWKKGLFTIATKSLGTTRIRRCSTYVKREKMNVYTHTHTWSPVDKLLKKKTEYCENINSFQVTV